MGWKDCAVLALPPGHVVGLLQEVVPHPTGDGHHRGVLLDEVLLPAHLVVVLVMPGEKETQRNGKTKTTTTQPMEVVLFSAQITGISFCKTALGSGME